MFQAFVLPIGLSIDCSHHAHGVRYDLEILQSRKDFHKEAKKKSYVAPHFHTIGEKGFMRTMHLGNLSR